MRDVVWTIILIWLVWKMYDMFKQASKRTSNNSNTNHKNFQQKKEGEVKIDKNNIHKPHFNANDGEYVDYEEIK